VCSATALVSNREEGRAVAHRGSDWYLVRQLASSGRVRGTDPLDTTGGQMRAMVTTLTDEQAMRGVVAYVTSLD
jgi:hypothetical protein